MDQKRGRGTGRGRGRPSRQGLRGRAGGVISCGPQARQSFPTPRTLVNPQNSSAVIDWITQQTSSSSSASATYRDCTPSYSVTPQLLPSQSAAAADPTTTTSSIVASLDLSEELFPDMSADAQELLIEDEGATNVSPPHMSHLHVNTPMVDIMCEDDLDELSGVGAVLEVSDVSEAVDDDEGMDATWQLPRRRDERGGVQRRRRRKQSVQEGGSIDILMQAAGGGHPKKRVALSGHRMMWHLGSASKQAHQRLLFPPPKCQDYRARQCGISFVCVPLITAKPSATSVTQN